MTCLFVTCRDAVQDVATPDGWAHLAENPKTRLRTVLSSVLVSLLQCTPQTRWGLFGEEPHELSRCYADVQGTDVFIAIGTSGLGDS